MIRFLLFLLDLQRQLKVQGTVKYPPAVVKVIRARYPDGAAGAYDDQHNNTVSFILSSLQYAALFIQITQSDHILYYSIATDQ